MKLFCELCEVKFYPFRNIDSFIVQDSNKAVLVKPFYRVAVYDDGIINLNARSENIVLFQQEAFLMCRMIKMKQTPGSDPSISFSFFWSHFYASNGTTSVFCCSFNVSKDLV